jgi:lipoate-protein ligase A
MIWRFIISGFNTGKYNMDLDLQLTRRSNKNEAVLRFYRWEPFCISLGANQPFDSVNLRKVSEAGLDVVKRPTGGRAILHAEELTYSVIHPITADYSPKVMYKEINLALKKGLGHYDPALYKLSLENSQPHFPSFYKDVKSNLCFAVSAKCEINFDGKKLVGSAQRKIGGAILQHGSILCGTFHRNLIDYLELSMDERTEVKKEIDETTTELETIMQSPTDYKKLILSLISGFEQHFNFSFESNKEFKLIN